MNIERKRKQECYATDCKYAETRCLIYHGNDCIRLDGNKIPLLRSVDKPYPSRKPSLVKPHFGTIDGWKIEDILNPEG